MMHKRYISLVSIAIAFFLLTGMLCADELTVGEFSSLDPGQKLPPSWEPMTFSNIETHTSYSLIRDSQRTVIKAHSQNAASGLIRHVRVDPREYPWLQWSWKIEQVLERGNVHTKEGDDYSARIYVAFAFEPEQASLWQRIRQKTAKAFTDRELPGTALNYIWANKADQETITPNPFVQESMMVVLQSGNARSKQWISEQRNILKDYQRAFGKEPPEIIGIGLMTDTDNTGEETTAYYGDIIFVPKDVYQ